MTRFLEFARADRPDLIQRLWRLHADPQQAANDLRLLRLQGRQGALHPHRQFLGLGFVQRRESLDGMKRLASRSTWWRTLPHKSTHAVNAAERRGQPWTILA